MKKPNHLSYSQINLGRCPYAYKRIRLDGDYEADNEHIRLGTLKHQVIYEYTKKCVKDHISNDFELMDKLIKKHFNKSGLEEKHYCEVRQSLLDWAERDFSWDDIVGCEIPYDVELVGGVKIKGSIDRINAYELDGERVLEITDYKNTLKYTKKGEVVVDLQLRIYVFIACVYLYPGFTKVRRGIPHLRHGFTMWSDYEYVSELAGEFEATEEFINRQWERLIEAEDYPCCKSDQCWEYNGCPVMLDGKCPAWSKAEVKRMMSGSIEDKVRALRKITQDHKDLKAELSAHFNINDPIEVDGSFVGYSQTHSHKYAWAIVEWAETNGVDLRKITLSKSVVEKAIKDSLGKIEELSEGSQDTIANSQIPTISESFTFK